MQIRDLKILSSVNLAVSAALLCASYLILSEPVSQPSARDIAKWEPSVSLTTEAPSNVTAETQLAEAHSRPLFRHSRRPFDPSQVTVAENVPEPPPPPSEAAPTDLQMTVKGVLLDGKTRKVLLASPETPDGIWLSEGAEISGWKIVKLGANGATLASGQQNLELKLYVDNAANTVGSP